MSRHGYLGPRHAVAAVVERLCREHLGAGSVARLVGGVGCGVCWERAIRADERAIAEFGLPRECPQDPDLVDEVAVELACAGQPVALTEAERVHVVAVLTARGVSVWRIAERLRMSERVVRRVRGAATSVGDGVAA